MIKNIFNLFIFTLLFWISVRADADVHSLRINEIMAENGDYSDWIEIYNSGDDSVSVKNLYLSDNLDDPKKWRLPSDLSLEPKAFQIFWTDGMDAGCHTNFKLKQKGKKIGLFNTDGKLLDTVNYSQQVSNISFGRQPDAGAVWRFFPEPTPGAKNNTQGFQENQTEKMLPQVQFSLPGGFYKVPQKIYLSSTLAGSEIRYTLDGSLPRREASLYAKPIPVNSTSIVRARIFSPGHFPGPVATHTYFINENYTLPVISIVTDPKNLWDEEFGIYTEGVNYDSFEGVANYLEDWERPISLEFYENNKKLGLKINAGMKIHGGSGRDFLQKSLAIHARKRFGENEIHYKLFPDEDIKRFKSFLLRNDGCCDDFRTLFRDAILHRIVKRQMDIDLQAYRPAVLFLNGKYWGILNIREKLNKNYLAAHHGVNPKQVDLLKEDMRVLQGDRNHYKKLMRFLESADMTSKKTYEYLCTQIDMNEYLNYQIAEIYSANTDWPNNNEKYWRTKTEKGKWRWILYDTDYAFVKYKHNTLKAAFKGKLLFRKLLEHTEFKNEFIQRLASHVNITFALNRVIDVINHLEKGIQAEVPRHIQKWGGTYGSHSLSSLPDWKKNIQKRRIFAKYRAGYLRRHIIKQFGLSGTAKLKIKVSPPGAGSIKIHQVKLPNREFTGIWFKDIPIRLQAISHENYQFLKWEGVSVDKDSNSVSLILKENTGINAVFQAKR